MKGVHHNPMTLGLVAYPEGIAQMPAASVWAVMTINYYRISCNNCPDDQFKGPIVSNFSCYRAV